MTMILLFHTALPGLPDTRLCSASSCEWLVALMSLFMLVLLVLLGLAVIFQIRNHFEKRSDSFWRRVM